MDRVANAGKLQVAGGGGAVLTADVLDEGAPRAVSLEAN